MPINDPQQLTDQSSAAFDDEVETLLLDGATTSEIEDAIIGQVFGAYRIERELGRGGMGAVYLATRADNVFQMQVAIKLIKRGMDSDFILGRFRNERQILASLDHPNIARLLDGGTADDGRPYFVMEYIAGQPLYPYCDARHLGLSERLQLFLRICDAVAHAHQNQIIHRDLKPSNILVSSEGQPKLLDFGIAKLLNPDLLADTLPPTATAMRMMTMEYASPEQIRGEAVTFLSDVYSLGVLLFELLTGQRPYVLNSRAPHEIARAICDVEPLRPSEAATQQDERGMKSEKGSAEELHRSSFPAPTSELVGNLDNIVLKALRKDPSHRYSSVVALRSDIQKHLNGQAVSAPIYFSAPPVNKPAQPSPSKRIAVLPLKLLSFAVSDHSGEGYLSIGLADAIITRLSNVRSLTVRPTSSVLRFGGESVEPFAAGRELNVDFVLDGRIKRAGDQVRVSVQLLDVNQQTTLWAEQFDEPFTDVLHLEDVLSTNVAEALVTQLTTEERARLTKRGTDNPQAFELYLQGRYHWSTFTPEGYARSLACNQHAIALDPNYAAAYVGIANYHAWMSVSGFALPAVGMEAARAAALKAIALDDSLAEAHGMLSWIAMVYDYDLIAAEQYEQRGLACNPHDSAVRGWRSWRLLGTEQFEESVMEAKLAYELDPLSSLAQQRLVYILYFARHYDESIATCRRFLATDSQSGVLHGSSSWGLRCLKRYDEAIAAADKAVQLLHGVPVAKLMLALAYAQAGRKTEAREILQRLNPAPFVQYISPYFRGLVHVWLDERETAFACFAEAFDLHDPWTMMFSVEPLLDPIRHDERYQQLAQRIRR